MKRTSTCGVCARQYESNYNGQRPKCGACRQRPQGGANGTGGRGDGPRGSGRPPRRGSRDGGASGRGASGRGASGGRASGGGASGGGASEGGESSSKKDLLPKLYSSRIYKEYLEALHVQRIPHYLNQVEPVPVETPKPKQRTARHGSTSLTSSHARRSTGEGASS